MAEPTVPVDLGRLANAFGLPALTAVEFRPGASGVWRLRSPAGEVALAVRRAHAGSYVVEELRTAGDLERRATAAGIDMVAYLEPLNPAVGLAALVDGHLAVLHRWAQVLPDDAGTVDPSWLGSTVARLHGCWPAPAADDGELRRGYGVHPLSHWRGWIAEAESAGLAWAPIAAGALGAMAEATELSLAGLRLDLPRCVTHRDLNPPNLLHTADGPLLCDFGYAGPDIAWLEVVDAALACAAAPAQAVAAYERAGGLRGPRVPEALARTTGATLMWLAFSMWLSLGHRRVPEARRAAATAAIPDIVRRLVADLESLDATAAAVFG